MFELKYEKYNCLVLFFEETLFFSIPVSSNFSLSRAKIKKLIESQIKIFLKKKKILTKEEDFKNISYVYSRYKHRIEVFIFTQKIPAQHLKNFDYVIPVTSLIKEIHLIKTAEFLKENGQYTTNDNEKEQKTEKKETEKKKAILLGSYIFPDPFNEDSQICVFLGTSLQTGETVFIDFYEIRKNNENQNQIPQALSGYKNEIVKFLTREHQGEVVTFEILTPEEYLERVLNTIQPSFCFKKKRKLFLKEIATGLGILALLFNLNFLYLQKVEFNKLLLSTNKKAQQYSQIQNRYLYLKQEKEIVKYIPQELFIPWDPYEALKFISQKIYRKDHKIWIDQFILDRKAGYNHGLVKYKLNIAGKKVEEIKNIYRSLYPLIKNYRITRTAFFKQRDYIIVTLELSSEKKGVSNEFSKNYHSFKELKKASINHKQKICTHHNCSFSALFRTNSMESVFIPPEKANKEKPANIAKEDSKCSKTDVSFINLFRTAKEKILSSVRRFFWIRSAYAFEKKIERSALSENKRDFSQKTDKNSSSVTNFQSGSGNKSQSTNSGGYSKELASFFKYFKDYSPQKQPVLPVLCGDNPTKIIKFYDKTIKDFMQPPQFLSVVKKDNSDDSNKKNKNNKGIDPLLKKIKETLAKEKEEAEKSVNLNVLLITSDMAVIQVDDQTRIVKTGDVIDDTLMVIEIDVKNNTVILNDLTRNLNLKLTLNTDLPLWKTVLK